MIVAFRKGFSDLLTGNWWLALGIMVRTWSVYTHVELQFSDGYSVTSSSAINDPNKDGVDIRPLDVSGKEWDRLFIWDITQFGYKDESEVRLKAEKLKKDNKGYSLDDLVSIFVGKKPNDESRYFCSEVIAYLLRRKPMGVTPGQLCAKLKKNERC